MPELKALTRERRLRGYSRLRKAELIAFLQDNAPQVPQAPRRQRPPRPSRPPPPKPPQSRALLGLPQMSTWEPIDDRLRPKLEEAPLTKRQLKHRRNKDSKLNKKFKHLEKDIDNLKSQMDSLKDKITKASESTNARFKRKKIRSMKRDFDKINEKLKESEKKLESRVLNYRALKLHPLSSNKCIEEKIAETKQENQKSKKEEK